MSKLNVFGYFLAFAAASVGVGCAFLKAGPEAQRARIDRYKCQVAALAPLTDNVLDTEELVKDLYAGKASIGAVLSNLHASQAEAEALIKRLEKCEPPPPAPSEETAS